MTAGNRTVYRGYTFRDRFYAPDARTYSREERTESLKGHLANNDQVPYVGVTTDGTAVRGLFSLEPTGVSTEPVKRAADEFLSLLSDEERAETCFPVESMEWTIWHNGQEMPSGLSLSEVSSDVRDAAMLVLKASLSDQGFETVRNAMKLNAVLGEMIGVPILARNRLGEWNYSFRILGTPSTEKPWGWQLHGHHVSVSCFVLGDQLVMTPSFIGAEPAIPDGQWAGLTVLQPEEMSGLRLMQSLAAPQREKATLYKSILSKDLPPELGGYADGRHQGGAFKDNLVLPYQGICASEFTAGQREGLVSLLQLYVGRERPGNSDAKMREVMRHLDETYFVWMGGCEDDSVFYYRVHSPVMLIEFDHHPGVFLNNNDPEKFHSHTIVRTPNGNDYGRDLLRQHYEREHGEVPVFMTLQARKVQG